MRIAEGCPKLIVNVLRWLIEPRLGKDGKKYRVENAGYEFGIRLIKKSKAKLWMQTLLELGQAYSVRLVEDSEWIIHVQVSSEIPSIAASSSITKQLPERIRSLDQNPFGIASTIVSRDGNLLYHRIFPEDKLIYARENKRDDALIKLVLSIIIWAHEHGAYDFVIKDLDIKNTREIGPKVNRLICNFVRKQFVERLMIRCWNEGNLMFVGGEPKESLVRIANPAYTSKIGDSKYKNRPGLSIHEAAAFCIGRRFCGFGEMLEEPITITMKRSGNSEPRERGARTIRVCISLRL